MESQSARFTSRLLAASTVLLAVFCGVWIMAAMGWIPATFDDDGGVSTWFGRHEVSMPAAVRRVPAPDAGASKNHIACGRCGVIESVHPVKKIRNPPGISSISGGKGGEVLAVLQVVLNAMVGNPTGPTSLAPSYEITVRFHDGSRRMLTETGKPAWKPGDPVKVVNGRIKPDA